MEDVLRAIEVTGTVDERRRLYLDEPLPIASRSRVRVIVLIPEGNSEASESSEEIEWLHSAAHNPAFDFLSDPEEDIYTPNDGRPFGDQR